MSENKLKIFEFVDLFEIVRQGTILFQTKHKECIPSAGTLKTMSKSGHTFRINGKRVSLDTLTIAIK